MRRSEQGKYNYRYSGIPGHGRYSPEGRWGWKASREESTHERGRVEKGECRGEKKGRGESRGGRALGNKARRRGQRRKRITYRPGGKQKEPRRGEKQSVRPGAKRQQGHTEAGRQMVGDR